jgi:transcriptional regulator with XRE-family HTH domain
MEQSIRKAICKRIKELRKKHGYSQEEVAALLNMGQSTYSELESGLSGFQIDRLYDIAKLYGVSIDSILPPPP